MDNSRWLWVNRPKSSEMLGLYRERTALTSTRAKLFRRLKIVLVSATIIISAVVLCVTLLSTATNKSVPQTIPVFHVTRPRKFNTNVPNITTLPGDGAVEGNSSGRTIYDELTVETNYTEVERRPAVEEKEASSERRMFDEGDTPVEEANPLRYFRVLDRRKHDRGGRKLAAYETDDERSYVERGRIMNRPSWYPAVPFGDPEYPSSGPYGYSPVPAFSEAYAQLEGYGNPTRIKSVREVLKYVSDERKPGRGTRPATAVKFAGVYMRTPDEDRDLDGRGTVAYSRPFFNGHAYISDPFLDFKPAHPSEINHLVPSSGETETGHRFSTKLVRPTLRPYPGTVYLPPYSDAAHYPSQVISPLSNSPGTQTEAIFRPYDSSTMPETTVPSLSDSSRRPDRKPKPFSVMMDIYPVSMEADQGEAGSEIQSETLIPLSVLNPRARQTRPSTTETNRMVVRLNLYPKKISKMRRRPGASGQTLLSGGTFQQRRSFEERGGEDGKAEGGEDSGEGEESGGRGEDREEAAGGGKVGEEETTVEAVGGGKVGEEETTMEAATADAPRPAALSLIEDNPTAE